jgi:hypothetical protein
VPFKSKAQNAWAHTEEGMDALGGPSAVKEWESNTDYSKLPEKKTKNKKFNYAPKTKSGFSKEQRLA